MRWVFCHVTIQQISSGEETFDISDYTPVYFTEYASPSPPSHFQWRDRGQKHEMGTLSLRLLLKHLTLCLHSEVKSEEKRKNGNEGMEERQSRPQGFSLKKMGPTHFLREKPWGRGWKNENWSLQPRSLCAWNKLREHLTSSSHITEQTSGFFALLKCRI